MKTIRLATFVVLTIALDAPAALAQTVRGFVGGGVISDVNQQRFPSAGGGIVVDLGQPWVAAGAQGETFWQWPYFAGRGTLFGQVNLRVRGALRPFVLAGVGYGETDGPMVGGGFELRPPHGGPGLRVSVEDYVSRIGGLPCGSFGLRSYCDENPRAVRGYVAHQVAIRAGVLF
jgi:hypothetical protein